MITLPTFIRYTHGAVAPKGQKPTHEIVYVNLAQVVEVRQLYSKPRDLTWEQAVEQKLTSPALILLTTDNHRHVIDKPEEVDLALAVLDQATLLQPLR